YRDRLVEAVAIGRELDEHDGVACAGGFVLEGTGRQLRYVIVEDDVGAAEEIARIDGTGLQGHFRALAQDFDAIDDHQGQQRELNQGGGGEQRGFRGTLKEFSDGRGKGLDHSLVLGSKRLSTSASAPVTAPAAARKAERCSSEPFTAQVMAAM